MKFIFNDGNQHVSRYGTSYLRLIGVLTITQELLDFQMVLVPLEEQLDLSTVLVECCDAQRRQDKVVGHEYERVAALDIFELNTFQILLTMLYGVKRMDHFRLIANNLVRSTHWCRIIPPSINVGFGAHERECVRLMQEVNTFEIQVATIHDIERTSFNWLEIEHVYLVQLPSAGVDKSRYCISRFQKCMQLDRALCFAKQSPIKQAQTQVYSGCVKRVDSVLQVETNQVRIAEEFAHSTNQQSCDVLPNAPIARMLNIGQRKAMNAVMQPNCIEFVRIGTQCHFDVAQTFALHQQRKGLLGKPLRAGHDTNNCVAAVAIDDETKARSWHELHILLQ